MSTTPTDPTSQQLPLETLPIEEKSPLQWQFMHPKNWAIWLLLLFILPLLLLPLRWQFALGRSLGKILYAIIGSRRKVTLVNLKLAFPDMPEHNRQVMAKQVFINQGIGLFESLSAWFRPKLFKDAVTIEGLEYLKQAQAENKAVLLLGGHYTLLDLGGKLCSRFFELDCVYRPQNNTLLEWFVFNARRHVFGKQIAHKDMRQLAQRIKQAKAIWYAPDQDYGLQHGVMATFFGVPAATITATRRLAKLGDKKNPPAVMGLHVYRQSPDHLSKHNKPRYHITITPALTNYPSHDELQDAQRINELLEQLISIDMTQWMWFHKRYKHNAAGRSDHYS